MLTWDPLKPDAIGKFRVGDKVLSLHGQSWWEGTVMEDRGNIGHGGRRLYRVSIPVAMSEPIETELSDKDLQLA